MDLAGIELEHKQVEEYVKEQVREGRCVTVLCVLYSMILLLKVSNVFFFHLLGFSLERKKWTDPPSFCL